MRITAKYILTGMVFFLTLGGMPFANGGHNALEANNVLVYTKTGEGYVHDNIPFSVNCIETLANAYGFEVTATDDPPFYTREKYQEIDFMVFSSTNNDGFDNRRKTENQGLFKILC